MRFEEREQHDKSCSQFSNDEKCHKALIKDFILKDDILNCPVKCPNKEEQQRIVNILDEFKGTVNRFV